MKNKSIKQYIKNIYWVIAFQFGLDLRKSIAAIIGTKRYICDLFCFRASYKGELELKPCLHDWNEEGGATSNEYFWQDLFVARKIFLLNPEKHLDVGSRVDGFIAHVASFREVHVLDIRPITTEIPGVIFKQADLMKPTQNIHESYDSISCLHALEHFGLGRYGDPIDAEGYVTGIKNIASLLSSKGNLYLSVPIGIERVEFNANRVFDPRTIIQIAMINSLELKELALVENCNINLIENLNDAILEELSKKRYALGIFSFIKS